MSIVALQNKNICKYLISQNCDGLHRRSGIQPEKISELHGNGNIELCEKCGFQYLRDFHAYRIGRGRDHFTGRYCVILGAGGAEPNKPCGGRLLESTIDFGQGLPQVPLDLAYHHARKGDLHVVLGSSLTVRPACEMPKITSKKGKLVICNLQNTPLTNRAEFQIYAKCNVVMEGVMNKLGIKIPQWKLRRFMKVKVKYQKGKKMKLSIKGIEKGSGGQMIPASIFKQVEVLLPEEKRFGKYREYILIQEPHQIEKNFEDKENIAEEKMEEAEDEGKKKKKNQWLFVDYILEDIMLNPRLKYN